jgi:hypothetical protein
MTNVEYYGVKNLKYVNKMMRPGIQSSTVYYIPRHVNKPIRLKRFVGSRDRVLRNKTLWLLETPKFPMNDYGEYVFLDIDNCYSIYKMRHFKGVK